MLMTIIILLSLAAALGTGSFLWGPLVFVGCFLALVVLAIGFVWVCSLLVDPQKPQEEDSAFVRGLAKLYAPFVFSLLRTKIVTSGTEKIPADGRFMMVCNHIHALDPGILLRVFPDKQLAFISKMENLKLPIVGPLMGKILCQSMDRDNDRQALKVILKCISILKEDKASIGVFPEGYTSKDCRLQPFRNGAFKIAQKAQVPIVVCTLQGTREILHNFIRFRSTTVQLHLVEVIQPEELAGKSTAEIGGRVHEIMARDLGQLV